MGVQDAWGPHMVVLLIPGALLLTVAHRAAATNSLGFVIVTSQVLCIVQEIVCVKQNCLHPTAPRELSGEGAQTQPGAYVSYDGPQQES